LENGPAGRRGPVLAMPLLEVIVSSLDDALAAQRGGADRFELCAALAVGGLTPSLGVLELIKERTPAVPVMAMVRPREGGMAYTAGERSVMHRDAERLLAAGADGLVTGFLTDSGEVDTAACAAFLKHCRDLAGERQWVFHRAFDVARDPRTALEQLVDLGFTRILTSGRAATAADGVAAIARCIEQAAGRIEILPGGGIRPAQVERLLRETGATQVHLSLAEDKPDPSAAANPAVHFGVRVPATELSYRAVSEAQVGEVRAILDRRP
jgi:copper homeostasis protein